MSTGFAQTHTSNTLFKRRIGTLKENVRIWCKSEHTKDWVRVIPVISLMMNSHQS